jgi:predicted porin
MFARSSFVCAGLSLLAGAAGAQSSVTLYGVVDVVLSRGTGSLTSLNSMGNPGGGGLMGSRLGVRGSEELGGGLKANFVLEHGFTPDTGAQASPLFWNRQVYVGLSGSLGEFQAGRIYTPTFLVHNAYDAFGAQGVAAQQVLLGSLQAAQPAAIRASNALNYLSPGSLGGIVVHAMWSASEGAPGAYRGLRLGYAREGFAGDVAFARFDQATLPAAPAPLPLGTLKALTLGARYKFGAFTLYGLHDRTDGDVLDSRGVQASASYLLGGLTELKVSVAQSTIETDAGVKRGTTRRVGIGAVRFLSKRTALYTSIAQVSNKDGASTALAGATTAPNQRSRGIDIGLRHAF